MQCARRFVFTELTVDWKRDIPCGRAHKNPPLRARTSSASALLSPLPPSPPAHKQCARKARQRRSANPAHVRCAAHAGRWRDAPWAQRSRATHAGLFANLFAFRPPCSSCLVPAQHQHTGPPRGATSAVHSAPCENQPPPFRSPSFRTAPLEQPLRFSLVCLLPLWQRVKGGPVHRKGLHECRVV